ncbi:MAG: hypothetical protein NTW73_02730 [Candidatus Parcubacteria bacterium]|nr:hypothetical protein [Candidatus Parcubacteria bacterium]
MKEINLEKMFLEAYTQYSSKIYKHIFFRVNNSQTAQDLTSETFLKTWRYLREGNKIENIKNFIYRVAHLKTQGSINRRSDRRASHR